MIDEEPPCGYTIIKPLLLLLLLLSHNIIKVTYSKQKSDTYIFT